MLVNNDTIPHAAVHTLQRFIAQAPNIQAIKALIFISWWARLLAQDYYEKGIAKAKRDL